MIDIGVGIPEPHNEQVRYYGPGTSERAALQSAISECAATPVDVPIHIDDREIRTPLQFAIPSPHRHDLQLGTVHVADASHVEQAIASARKAAPAWAALDYTERARIFLKVADLISGPMRDILNAATMLGQSKSVHQAEIDAACESADFLRFNAAFGSAIMKEQPLAVPGLWNAVDYRPLEGFVLAVSPFNFTCVGLNLVAAPALMGNVVVWKPSEKAALAAEYVYRAFRAAGVPPGVINVVHGDAGELVGRALDEPDFAGLHFTGSTAVFRGLSSRIYGRIEHYRSFPRLVGETGGKDFILAHPSADIDTLVVALVRGAFEYQGQKCASASRAYIPSSLWGRVRDQLHDIVGCLKMGDVADFATYVGAVIDEGSFRRQEDAIARARCEGAKIVVGGNVDRRDGWFVAPTVLEVTDPHCDSMSRELFGPILSVWVYDDKDWDDVLTLVDGTSPYALTGSVFAQDRPALSEATKRLRNAAGNLYINDKPTGSVVGQQPFGGMRGSGTNDKTGSPLNLLRWVSPRAIKENFAPASDWRYPHLSSAL